MRVVSAWLLCSCLACAPNGPNEPVAAENGSPTTEAPPAVADLAATVGRGEYLSMISGCQECHTPGGMFGTPDRSRSLAGSEVGWSGPWGVTYPSNLTPHETGLAGWSQDDIVRALRTGTRPDGSKILPPMPWPHFAHLTDEDAYAIAAYLQSLAPIDHQEPPTLPPGAPPPEGAVIQLPPPPAWDEPPGS